jgi:hypothetical protein
MQTENDGARKTVKAANDEVLQSLPLDEIYVVNAAHLTVTVVVMAEFRNKHITLC